MRASVDNVGENGDKKRKRVVFGHDGGNVGDEIGNIVSEGGVLNIVEEKEGEDVWDN